jgi:hypothetical protein
VRRREKVFSTEKLPEINTYQTRI